MQHILNIDESKILHVQHVGYFTSEDSTDIILNEVRIVTYPHPEVPEYAAIQRMETAVVYRAKKGSYNSAPMEVLKNTQNTVRQLFHTVHPECGKISVDTNYNSLSRPK